MIRTVFRDSTQTENIRLPLVNQLKSCRNPDDEEEQIQEEEVIEHGEEEKDPTEGKIPETKEDSQNVHQKIPNVELS